MALSSLYFNEPFGGSLSSRARKSDVNHVCFCAHEFFLYPYLSSPLSLLSPWACWENRSPSLLQLLVSQSLIYTSSPWAQSGAREKVSRPAEVQLCPPHGALTPGPGPHLQSHGWTPTEQGDAVRCTGTQKPQDTRTTQWLRADRMRLVIASQR